MKILKSQKDVSECASALKLPAPILAELSKSVSLVEVVREEIPSARACVILLDSEDKKAEILRKHGINDLNAETSEDIDLGKEKWRREVYVIDDAGDGVIIFRRASSLAKFDTE